MGFFFFYLELVMNMLKSNLRYIYNCVLSPFYSVYSVLQDKSFHCVISFNRWYNWIREKTACTLE